MGNHQGRYNRENDVRSIEYTCQDDFHCECSGTRRSSISQKHLARPLVFDIAVEALEESNNSLHIENTIKNSTFNNFAKYIPTTGSLEWLMHFRNHSNSIKVAKEINFDILLSMVKAELPPVKLHTQSAANESKSDITVTLPSESSWDDMKDVEASQAIPCDKSFSDSYVSHSDSISFLDVNENSQLLAKKAFSNKDSLASYDPDSPDIRSRRFSEELNSKYCSIAVSKYPSFKTAMYMQYPSKEHHDMCHVKTQLIVTAMKEFFWPYEDVEVVWVSNITVTIKGLLYDEYLEVKFPQHQCKPLEYYQGALALRTSDADVLIRHPGLCFLHTLAAVTDIDPSSLLVVTIST